MTIRVYEDPRSDFYSLIVVNQGGILRKIYTPFRVLCVVSIEGIQANTQVYVDAVFCSESGEIYYVIFQRIIKHVHFHILVSF